MQRATLRLASRVFLLAAICGVVPPAEAGEPPGISGVYPHLAVLSNGRTECGIGAVVPWADRLWLITYPAHFGDGRLFEVDPQLKAIVTRPESAGGTHAGRMIHRESNQLLMGPYVIDARGNVKVIKEATKVRVTAIMRHLADPANKVYLFGMEGEFLEADVRTAEGKRLFRVQDKGVTGSHGKGGYTGQGRVVVANNGGKGGGLAEWDGDPDHDWRLIEHKQFCEVTGPGGIDGAADDRSPEIPLWATGWDHRSVIVKVLDRGTWHTFRVPKASYTHDPEHGWFTEWPRIRQIEPGRYMMSFHGTFFDFPGDFRPGRTCGLRPIATHLRMPPDWCSWGDRLVMAGDDDSVTGNPLGGMPQSNLWFTTPAGLKRLGKPAGWGGPWVRDAVQAGVPSDPYLLDGFEKRVVHLANHGDTGVKFTLEIDAKGDGHWQPYQAIAVPAAGYAYHIFPADVEAAWVRLKLDKDSTVTAYFHFTSSGGPVQPDQSAAARLFAGLAPAGGEEAQTSGLLLPASTGGRLQFAAQAIRGQSVTDAGVYESGADVKLRVPAEAAERAAAVRKEAAIKTEFAVDDASVVIHSPSGTYRLPKTHPAYNRPGPAGWPRCIREVVTERNLMNCHGTFYELPRAGIAGVRPVATHERLISDFCSWRGLLAMAGTRLDARPDGHFVASEDGKVGLWLGMVDDLWQFGKPRGIGGPWRNTPVKAGAPSDPYLMTGYDRKRIELSHDAAEEVAFTVEVDFLKTGPWVPFTLLRVPADKPLQYEFPDGYAAHWVRLKSSKDCRATAWFLYQ